MEKNSRTTWRARKDTVENVTVISVMANTNKRITTESAFQQFEETVEDLFQNSLFGSDTEVDEVFGNSPWVTQINVKSFGIEVGNKQLRGHVHLVVEIKHIIPRYSIRKLRIRLKSWLDSNSDWSSWNIYLRLSPTYQENYANKEARWANNDKVEKEQANNEEFQELSEDKEMKKMVWKMKNLRVLDGNENIFDQNLNRTYNKKT
jgi:hypothetical protein